MPVASISQVTLHEAQEATHRISTVAWATLASSLGYLRLNLVRAILDIPCASFQRKHFYQSLACLTLSTRRTNRYRTLLYTTFCKDLFPSVVRKECCVLINHGSYHDACANSAQHHTGNGTLRCQNSWDLRCLQAICLRLCWLVIPSWLCCLWMPPTLKVYARLTRLVHRYRHRIVITSKRAVESRCRLRDTEEL